uniref:Uncharacterized protein n=1 Tax=Equus asinus TaxID=9793 RepID=A0A9L0JT79_EQUAS
MDSLGFSIYKSMLSVNSKSFTSSFPSWIPFMSSSSLIVLAKTSSTMLNKSVDSEHACLVPVLRGMAFSFSPLSMMFAVSFSYMTFMVLSYLPPIPILLKVFIINGCCILSDACSASIEMICGFCSSFC